MRYEYKVTRPDEDTMSDGDLETWLNEMAQDGWDLVAVAHVIATRWVFRRAM